jgi:hypothetical protein
MSGLPPVSTFDLLTSCMYSSGNHRRTTVGANPRPVVAMEKFFGSQHVAQLINAQRVVAQFRR